MTQMEEALLREAERQIKRELTTCVYFNGIQYAFCRLGVSYKKFEDEKGRLLPNLPCRGKSNTCQFRKYPTEAELRAGLPIFQRLKMTHSEVL
jgi:hypothetical protein